MISLEATVSCDSCGQIVASGTPTESGGSGEWAWRAVEVAMEKAKKHGARVGVSTVTCAECIEKQELEKHGLVPSPSGDPCHDNFAL